MTNKGWWVSVPGPEGSGRVVNIAIKVSLSLVSAILLGYRHRRKGSLRNLPISNETYRNEHVVMDDDQVETFK